MKLAAGANAVEPILGDAIIPASAIALTLPAEMKTEFTVPP